jgi:DNA-binding NtrC family response regulator
MARPSDELETLRLDNPTRRLVPRSHDLVIVEGPDVGKRHHLVGDEPSRVLLGKGPACALRLTDPEVSRRHAAIATGGPELRLWDLESTNGTFVDGVRVVETYLRDGQILRLGKTVLRIDGVPDGEAIPPGPPSVRSFGKMIGNSQAMRQLYPLCERLAQSDVPIVIEGETGTGKEVLAESIHEASPRASGPFVVFDCTTVAPTLVEAALFGHERGAFTGAVSMAKGVFEQAHGGTLFIDEIGDLDRAMQPKLLRALQRSEVKRVGGTAPIQVNVRIVAATRRDLDREVQADRFRDDLFFRLVVGRIELPPLRLRRGDIGLLARHFWDRLGGKRETMPVELFDRFEDYPWPGNIRELENTIARCLALGDLAPAVDVLSSRSGATGVDAEKPTDFLDALVMEGLPFALAREQVIDEFEKRYVRCMIDRHGGNITRAAHAAGIARRYFHLLRAKRRDDGSGK